MYTIYAIKSQKDERIYVGFTENLLRRLYEHNGGHVTSTKAFIPWKLLYTEQVADRVSARKREKKLKSGYGKEFLKKLK
ncbi:TPA: endonuclease [Candidatus Uhrbacteria bacterium]|nr:endonuclease [Candidatus Uhrbacteria bacterium]